jgi:predicted Rossmann fold flavoprotein
VGAAAQAGEESGEAAGEAMSWPLAVIGGGAAGIMAALQAAERGVKVAIFERNPRCGKKILISGNGRCNVTNVNAGPDTYTGTNPHFAKSPLSVFGVWPTLSFFEDLGLEWKEEGEGRVFPVTNQASSVLELLEYRLAKLGVEIVPDARLADLARDGDRWKITLHGGAVHEARRVVMTPGSNAYPQLGTTGDGYEIMQRLGHALVPRYPSLVPLLTDSAPLQRLQGIRMQVDAVATIGGKPVASRPGEVLFTAHGISGPVPLWLSGPLAMRIAAGEKVTLTLNLMPGKDEAAVDELLAARWTRDPERPLAFSFVGLLPRKVGPELVAMVGGDPEMAVGSVPKGTRRALARLMSALEVPVSGLAGLDQAEVSGGGVATDQVTAKTMESKLQPGLHLAGEILDIHGDWGGYNFQFAWSTGWVAGTSAAEALLKA